MAYNVIHNFDLSCVSETFLNFETAAKTTNFETPGYNLFRSNNPFTCKRGALCIFYRAILPLKILDISNLNECITFGVSVTNNIYRIIHLYRFRSQTQDIFQVLK